MLFFSRNVKAEEAERNWRVFDKLKSDMKHLFRGLAFAYDRQKILISLNPIHDLNNPKVIDTCFITWDMY